MSSNEGTFRVPRVRRAHPTSFATKPFHICHRSLGRKICPGHGDNHNFVIRELHLRFWGPAEAAPEKSKAQMGDSEMSTVAPSETARC